MSVRKQPHAWWIGLTLSLVVMTALGAPAETKSEGVPAWRQARAAGRPVLLEFSAPWCGSCRRMEPVVDRLQRQWSGRVEVVKVNVDLPDGAALARRMEVKAIPMFLFVDASGSVRSSLLGQQPEAALVKRLKQISSGG